MADAATVSSASKSVPGDVDLPSSFKVFLSRAGSRVSLRTSLRVTYAGGDSDGEVGDEGAPLVEAVVKAVLAWLTSSLDGIGYDRSLKRTRMRGPDDRTMI